MLLIGKHELPIPLPQGIYTVPYVPHSVIFPRAAAIIHQGGIGTIAQGLRSGRPTLIMPYIHDQPDNAARAQRLGTSQTISRNRYTADRVAQHLHELLRNADYTHQAVNVQRRIQSENGVEMACNAIEQQL